MNVYLTTRTFAGYELCLGRKLYQHAVCLTTPKKAKK